MSVPRPPIWKLAAAYLAATRPPFSLRRCSPASCDVAEHPVACPRCGGTLTFVRPDRPASSRGRTTVVLIHGSPGTWRAWAPYLTDPGLRLDFDLVALDRPGYGGSRGCRCNRSLDTQGALLSSLLQQTDPGNGLVIVGHSFGGPLALDICARLPERVRACLLLAPSLDPSLERPLWFQRLAASAPISAVIPAPVRACNEEILLLRQGLEQQAAQLGRLSLPIACLHGDLDNLVPVTNADYLAQRALNTRVEVEILPGANHDIPWTHTDRVVATLRRLGEGAASTLH